MSGPELCDHYLAYGRGEGRIPSSAALRENFLSLIPQDAPLLEIGPFCNPCVVGTHVRYFDVLHRAGLIARAERIGIDHSRTPEIHFTSPTGDLSVIPGTFGGALSSHCLEHQIDLIAHLNQVAQLLRPNGSYFLLVPDKRFCFDHFIAESTIAGVMEAHLSGRATHTVQSVIEHRALTTHNDPARHWQGDHGSLSEVSQRVSNALSEVEDSAGTYIDVHAWQFTPDSFRVLMDVLRQLRLTVFHPVRIYDTPFGRLEFCAVLQKSS